jgi:FKBP-type peptidyl-prolyl cis-trans isomerase FkpA
MTSHRPARDRSAASCISTMLLALWSVSAILPARAAPATATSDATANETLPSAEARRLYTLGQLISRTLDGFSLNEQELAWVKSGIDDGVLGRSSKVDLAAEAEGLTTLQADRRAATLQREKSAGTAYLAAVARTPGVERLESGLIIESLQAGNGERPSALDHVSVHYEGRLIDGTLFESSRSRGTPATLPVRGVIPCWSQALQKMRVGSRSRIICPAELAYGERGSPPAVKPGATLVFDIELLAVVR